MGRLIYSAITSLDGYIADATGTFDWAAPDEEVHTFVNDLQRPIGTFLFGRRMYDVMAAWETMPVEHEPPVMRDFAQIWKAADKIVYSTTLAEPSTPRTRIEQDFDPEEVRRLKADADQDLSIGGATIAAEALRAGLVDEIQVLLNPIIVGGGTAYLPDDVWLDLELIEQRSFAGGVVYLRYAVKP